HMGEFEPQGYVDALELLNRGADFNYAADDRTTLMKLLSKQRQEFTERGATPPPEYTAVCDWLATHGYLQRPVDAAFRFSPLPGPRRDGARWFLQTSKSN